jgi:hypothetical protein
MRKAEIVDGVVVNILEVNPNEIPDWCADWPDAEAETGIGHTWDGSAFRSPAIDVENVAFAVRRQRDDLLQSVVDPIAGNVLRWEELHSEKKIEFIAYRRALLDVTSQSGFPLSVEWPTQPAL